MGGRGEEERETEESDGKVQFKPIEIMLLIVLLYVAKKCFDN